MTGARPLGPAWAADDHDTITVPALDLGWLDGDSEAAGSALRELAGGVLAVGLLVCAIAFVVAIALWVAARATGGAVGGKHSTFFAGGTGAALLGMVLLGSLVGATGWGADTVARWATTLVPVGFSG